MSYFNSPAVIDSSRNKLSEPVPVREYPTSANTVNSEKSLSDYLQALKKYKKSAALIVASTIVLTIFVNYSLIPKYVSSGTIKIDTNPQRILDYGVNAKQLSSSPIDPMLLQTQYKLLRSRRLASLVISELYLDRKDLEVRTVKPFIYEFLAPIREAKIVILNALGVDTNVKETSIPEQIFLKNLSIKPIKNTSIVEIQYLSNDPELSADIVNQLINTFIEKSIGSKKKTADNAIQFLKSELSNARLKLQDSEESLLKYAKKKKIINTGSNRSILARNLEALSSAYIRAKEQRIIAESIYSKKQNISAAVQANSSQLIGKLKEQYASLSAQYQEGLKTYKANYPTMLSIQAQIKDIKQQIQAETRSLTSSINNDLKSSLQSAQQQERQLNQEIHTYEKRLLSFEDKNLHYVNLQREADTNRALYDGLLQRLKQVGVASGSESETIEVIDTALPPLKSNAPKKGLNLLVGTMLGLLLAALSSFLRYFLNNKITSLEDLYRLNLPYPVLTTLPKVSRSEQKGLAQLAIAKPRSTLAESVRYLHINLQQQVGGVPQLLHFTSALPAEGKSNIVTNLATILAKSGKKVLIIDSDLRKPTIHKYLKVDNREGLSNFLSGNISTIPLQKVSIQYPLFVIPAGPSVDDPVNLLSNARMIYLCDKVRNTFDHILLDSPPVLGLADALVLSNRSDGTVFVISSNKADEAKIHSAINNLEKGFANLVGIVFSKEGKNSTEYYSSDSYFDGRQALV